MKHLADQGFENLQINSYLLTTKTCGKKVSPPLKLYVKSPSSKKKKGTRKFNYKLIFMKNYICTNKLHASSILLADVVNKISLEYRIEHIET